MPVIPNDDFAQFNFIFGGENAPTGAQVTLGAAIVPEPDPEGYAQVVGQAWADEIMPFLAAQLTLVGVLCKIGPNDLGPSALVGFAEVGGAQGVADLPSGALLVRKVTAGGGRANRGRMFVPGVVEANWDAGGELDAGDLAAYQGAFDALRGELIGLGVTPVVLHDEASPVTDPTPITSFEVQPRAATQRRRLRR